MRQSSESLDRPAIQELLTHIQQGKIERIVVYSIDRLTRKLYDLHTLLELFDRQDVTLCIVTDPRFGESAGDRLMTNIVAAASEFQLEITRERMADARAALKRLGRRVAGRIPYGYLNDIRSKQLVISPPEADVVLRMFLLAAAEQRPQEIADHFNHDGIPGSGGKIGRWTARQVLKILANPVYAGFICDGDGLLPGQHDAIVDESLYVRARKCIEARRVRAPGRSAAIIEWPLRNIVVCGECGRTMTTSISGYKNVRYRYYRCRSRASGRPPCKKVGISAFELEEFVRATLASELAKITSNATPNQGRRIAWHELDRHAQLDSLSTMLTEVRFNPRLGTITLTFADGPFAADAPGD